MREYIKANNDLSLFFFHLLFPVLEMILILVLLLLEPNTNALIILASAFGIGHLAMVSQIYKRSITPESLNYLLSLGEARQSIFKEIIEIYAREIIIYTLSMGLLMYFTNSGPILPYIGLRFLFALIAIPIFLNNLLSIQPIIYAVFSLYYVLGSQNIGVLILISIPISLYLMIKFKKTMLKGNLI